MSYFDDNEDRIIYGMRPRRRYKLDLPPTFSCPTCGQTGLYWTGIGEAAYLFKPGLGRHICHVGVLNDFEDLTK